MPGTPVASRAGANLGEWSSGESLQPVSVSLANSVRFSAVTEQLALHMEPGYKSDPLKFAQLCLALARGIDYSIGNNEVLPKVQHLAVMLKQICQRRNDNYLQAAIMVLMFSVKNACNRGWFSDKEAEELLALANEIHSSYSSVRNSNAGNTGPISTLSTIMTKFYPLIKLGHILVSAEVKPGYEAVVLDFQISKNIVHSPQAKIRLFVAQTDNMETSACIINPQQVNFLLNGKAVEKRTNVMMDSGPQMPTNVMAMLKFGTNLLQAVGQFNSHYLIVIAFMGVESSPDATTLLDYVQPDVSGNDSDLDIIEGSSRISLNCPISYTRIKTPVKGHYCKHLQCFDFHNFVDINSRRPSWRCPLCNQYVCYADIRVDQNIFKILKEVGDNVSEVLISAEGSWKAVLENDEDIDRNKNETYNLPEEGAANFFDLTEDNFEMDSTPIEVEDMKPSRSSLEFPSNFPLELNADVSQRVVPTEIDDFWSGFLNPPSSASTSMPDVQVLDSSNNTLLPVFNENDRNRGYANRVSTSMHSQFSPHNNMQIQDSWNPPETEYGSVPAVPRHVNRTPISIQALPVQSSVLGQQHRRINNLSSSSIMPAIDDLVHRNLESPGHLSRHHGYPHHIPNRPAMGAVPHPSTTQIEIRDRPLPHRPFINQSTVSPSLNRLSPLLTNFQNQHLQQSFNPRINPNTGQPHPTLQQLNQMAAQHAASMVRHAVQNPNRNLNPFQPNIDRGNSGGRPHSVSTMDDLPSEQDWRPTGQMRGSLTGRAFSAALDNFIIRPTQLEPPQPARIPQNSMIPTPNVPNYDPARRV